MANLVIVESPAKASTIKGYLGSNYKVLASKGHVRDLPKSSLGIDTEDNFKAHYINIRGKGDLIKGLKKEAKNADKIFLATDPDREGEAISWHLSTALDINPEKTKRITFNEITKSAVKDAIKNPRDIDMDLVNSQQARRILDRIVGYKLSPFLWKNVKSGLSAGRVQSVAARIIVERENEIRAFEPKEYWTIDVDLLTPKGKPVAAKFYGDKNGKIELNNEQETQTVVDAVSGKTFTVAEVRKSTKQKSPAPPFITSTLQQEASKKLNFQSQRTMRVAQELYEGVNLGQELGGVQGLITYMRTDSLRISLDAQTQAREHIIEKFGDKYYPETPRVFKSKANAQDAHEAVRPSNPSIEPGKVKKVLTSDQFKLYKLIWDRFIASQMASAEINTVTADIECEGYIFRSSGYNVKFNGYMAVYEESSEEGGNDANFDEIDKNSKIPTVSEGEVLSFEAVKPQQHFTEPPPRYTEASLIKFLEEKGIGRPSTYTPIISIILSRGYVSRDGKSLVPTPLGEVTTKVMEDSFSDIVDYKFTANLEDKLDEIENGKNTMENVLTEFYKGFSVELEKAEATISKGDIEVPVEETDIICELCGSKMIIKNGRFGKFAACPNYPECKNTKPLAKDGSPIAEKEPEIADFKCELCGSDMILRTGRYGSFYACVKYPECKYTKQKVNNLGVNCPECGADIVTKWGKNKNVFYSCSKYPECSFSSWDMPTAEKCPECGDMLLRKKGKNIMVCRNQKCSYKKEFEPSETEAESNSEE